MNLSHGRPYLAIPGPSVMPDAVLRAMHQAAPNIYAGALPDMVETLWPDLRALAGTKHHVALYIANGHGAWEAANANLFSRGDRALVLATGRFGHGWKESAMAMGVQVDLLDYGTDPMPDLARLEAALRADTTGALRAVLLTQKAKFRWHVSSPCGAVAKPAAALAANRNGKRAIVFTCLPSGGAHQSSLAPDSLTSSCQRGNSRWYSVAKASGPELSMGPKPISSTLRRT